MLGEELFEKGAGKVGEVDRGFIVQHSMVIESQKHAPHKTPQMWR